MFGNLAAAILVPLQPREVTLTFNPRESSGGGWTEQKWTQLTADDVMIHIIEQ